MSASFKQLNYQQAIAQNFRKGYVRSLSSKFEGFNTSKAKDRDVKKQNQWLFEAPFSAEAFHNRQFLFEAPLTLKGLPDYSEGTGRKRAAKRIDPKSINGGDILRGGVEPIRKPRQKPRRTIVLPPQSTNRTGLPIDPREVAKQQANRQGAILVSSFKKQLEKSNPSGTAVRAQARLRAGAEMIRQAKRIPDALLADAYKTVGQQLIDKGNADIHPSRS